MPSKIGSILGRQVGPLPVGAWLAVVAGGLGLGYLASRSPSASDTPAETGPANPDGQAGTQTVTPAIDPYGGLPAYDPGPYVPPPYTAPSDPYVPPVPVPSDMPQLPEITINMPSPEPQPTPAPAAVPRAPAPTTTQPKPGKTYLPNVVSSYTTKKGDTIASIAAKPGIRGTFPGGAQGLYNANKGTIDAAAKKAKISAVGVNTPLPAGITLRIP